tara:strand:- start:585 stop:785 length:201 start_codon:yes stop_codon:yes gene_type:complete
MAGSANAGFTPGRPTRMSAARIATTMATERAGADERLAGIVTTKVPFSPQARRADAGGGDGVFSVW